MGALGVGLAGAPRTCVAPLRAPRHPPTPLRRVAITDSKAPARVQRPPRQVADDRHLNRPRPVAASPPPRPPKARPPRAGGLGGAPSRATGATTPLKAARPSRITKPALHGPSSSTAPRGGACGVAGTAPLLSLQIGPPRPDAPLGPDGPAGGDAASKPPCDDLKDPTGRKPCVASAYLLARPGGPIANPPSGPSAMGVGDATRLKDAR